MRPKPKIRGGLTQKTQDNKFIESELKNCALINWTMASENLKDNLNKTADTNRNKFTAWGGHCSYKSIGTKYNYILDCYNVLSPVFFATLLKECPFRYIVSLELSLPYTCWSFGCYLSTCPIRHPLWPFVSCDCQCSTVQRSYSHKYDQKSSCNAFNEVVVAFP